MEKSSEIKLRLLQVAKNKGVSYEKFFKDIGTTYANFKGKSLKSSLRSEVLVDFSTIHPEVDLNWVITGKERQVNFTPQDILQDPQESYNLLSEVENLKALLKSKDETIKAKSETIAILKSQLDSKGECPSKAS